MTKLFLALAFAFAALLIACDNGDGGEVTPTAGVTPGATVSPEPEEETPTVGPEVCQPNPDPADTDVAQVDAPSAGGSVTSPVTVSGSIVAFEAQFKISIFDADGEQITDTIARSEEGQVLSPFSADVFFDVSEDTPACIWVYDVSGADGITPVNVVQIPVTLHPGGQPQVCQTNPDPAASDVTQVDAPAAGDSVTSPVTVSGRMAVSEAQFNITIFDAAGDPIIDVPGHTEEGFVLSPFSEDVAFSVGEPTPACIWVYDISERDGSRIQVVQIPVTLLP
jgi:uncharacterized protein (UPF0212 family)